ncbi:MAG: glycosyltransferase family 2 protein [Ichthyobacteriaceae bacterium]|nr:glycosyltransferase family 2 protein [Ichthyobacteriaceae bacterium]
MLKVAVVILNWNGKELLKKFVPSVVKYSGNAEVIVADNASTDNSVEFIKNNFPDVTIIQNSANGGYAKGYNDSLKHVDADIFVLVNSDIEVTENWLNPVVDKFLLDKNTAIIQPKILDYKNKSKFEYAGAGGGFIDSFGYPYCRGRIFNTVEEDKGQYNNEQDIFWASGACFFIRKDVFNKLGGFDENYFAHMEEIDLCWRTINYGYKIKYVSSSVVYHVGGATLNSSNPKKTYLNFRNSLVTLVKNLPSNKILPVILSRLVLDGIAGAKFLFDLKPKHTFAIIKAHFSFYFMLKYALQQRKLMPNFSVDYYGVKSVVKEYYIGKKDVFTKL